MSDSILLVMEKYNSLGEELVNRFNDQETLRKEYADLLKLTVRDGGKSKGVSKDTFAYGRAVLKYVLLPIDEAAEAAAPIDVAAFSPMAAAAHKMEGSWGKAHEVLAKANYRHEAFHLLALHTGYRVKKEGGATASPVTMAKIIEAITRQGKRINSKKLISDGSFTIDQWSVAFNALVQINEQIMAAATATAPQTSDEDTLVTV